MLPLSLTQQIHSYVKQYETAPKRKFEDPFTSQHVFNLS